MYHKIITVGLLLLAFLVTSVSLRILGISLQSLKEQTRLTNATDRAETFTAKDGALVSVACQAPRGSVPVTLIRCNAFAEGDFLLAAELLDKSEGNSFRQVIRVQLTPRLADPARPEAVDRGIELANTERVPQEFVILSIHSRWLGLYTTSDFDVDEEAIKALLASYVSTAAEVYDRELSPTDIERISEHMANLLATYTGAFEIRRNALLMLLQGGMEYLIFGLAVTAILLLCQGIFVFCLSDDPEAGNVLFGASNSLGGALTYLGLLGTLIGMFGTVAELSSIDFVDEMRKIFDQTRSFGSMSLAIGTSVIGLTGSVIVWMSHIVVGIGTGRDMY